MTTLPISGYMSDNARTQGQMKTAFENQNSVIREMLGGATSTTATISSGAFVLANDIAVVVVDTEASGATDDLTNITQTTARDGRCMVLKSTSNNRIVVIKNASGGSGQFSTMDGLDRSLVDTKQVAHFRYDAALTTWVEIPFMDWVTVNRLPGMAQETSLTLATDAVVPTQFLHELICETGTPGSATDNFSTLTQTHPINVVLVHTKTAGDVITLKHNTGGTGKMLTTDSADISLDSPNKFVLFMRKTTTWEEIARFGFTASGLQYSTKAANFTAAVGDQIYVCTAAAVCTLPTLAASKATASRICVFNDTSAADVSFDADSGEFILGALTYPVNPGESITLIPGNTEWKVA